MIQHRQMYWFYIPLASPFVKGGNKISNHELLTTLGLATVQTGKAVVHLDHGFGVALTTE